MHHKSVEEVLKEFDTDLNGLTVVEAEKRLQKNGYNELPKGKQETIFNIIMEQLKNPIIYILLIAAIFSFIVGEMVDFIFILVVIFLDAFLGTVQEYKALKNSETLQNLIKDQTLVLRDNKSILIDSKNLVVGDIVLLASGDKINADLRILESENLEINESILTGESLPVSKNSKILEDTILSERKNMAYAATIVTKGRAKAIVIATSNNTEIGKIADATLLKKNEKTPLIKRMEKFTKTISYITIFVSIVIVIILYLKDYPSKEIFLSVVALAVSAIPEGLPVALTLTLSLASNKMAKRNVIVKKLNSVESLGSCTVIASDKTGTLTLNEQTAKKIWIPNQFYDITGLGYNDEGIVQDADDKVLELALMGMINNEATLVKKNKWEYIGDSMDVAFLALAYKLNIKNNIKITKMIPYESEKKYSAVFYEENGKTFCTIKGSVDTVLSFCKDKNMVTKNDELASDGYRVIAIAKGEVKDTIQDLDFLGLVGFIDPIREDAIESIAKCHNAGIKVVMITGDHPLTATTIAKQLNLINDQSQITDYYEIQDALTKGETYFDKYIKEKIVFARVTPIQKLAIVESYKRQGEFIAVTGDGVNDAPALKSANIGIAMGSGTDVAKETSSMIIADDNFSSIVNGIEEGRVAYNNVRKVIYLLITCGLAEIIFFLLAILFNLPIPFIAVQLLWLNLVTNGLQDAALAFEKKDIDVLNQKPRSPKENIFDKQLIIETTITSIVIGLTIFFFFKFLIDKGLGEHVARGYILLLMVFMQNLHALNARSEYCSIFKIPIKNNYFVVFTVILTFILQLVVSQSSFLSGILGVEVIPFYHIIFIFLLALPVLLISEVMKRFFKKNYCKG